MYVRKNPILAVLAPAFTYSHQAASAYLSLTGQIMKIRYYTSFPSMFVALAQNKVDKILVAVENTYGGSVNATIRSLAEHAGRIEVQYELSYQIRHLLVGLEKAKLSKIMEIFSHEQAIIQCTPGIEKLGLSFVAHPVSSTAEGAKIVKAKGKTKFAAIAGIRAAREYGLKVLARDIGPNGNITRFFIVGKEPGDKGMITKTSLIVEIDNYVGSLDKVFSILTSHDIDKLWVYSMTTQKNKLSQGLWEYLFCIEIAGHREDENVKAALEEIESYAQSLKVLGSFPIAMV